MFSDTAHLPIEAGPLSAALQGWKNSLSGAGVLALVPEAEAGKIPVLQAACRQHGVALAGAVFPALIDGASEVRSGVRLICLELMAPMVVMGGLDAPSVQAEFVERCGALREAADWGSAPPILFTIFDSTLPNLDTILRGFADRLEDRFRYVGANAGSESFAPIPCLFDGFSTFERGGLALLLPPHDAVAVEHGFNIPITIMRVSQSHQNIIAGLNGRPAFEVYQEMIASGYGVAMTADTFYSEAVHFPLAILSGNSLPQIRIPVALGADQAITCVGEVQEGAVAVVMKAPSVEESDCVARIADRLGPGLAGLLTFYCAGRRMHLGVAQVSRELGQLAVQVGTPNQFGALSLGEISADSHGDPVFHNAALVCLGVTRRSA
ncbi:FIST signal transduction protein [Magnetospirillum moscoviense]|uniref:FIST C-domain domain-containing protein n=1 Tax=Magnetospirillum moscoviense TaxID=1437059 RepID=A0A178MIL9_9PROT|nr:FIST C-terminal domain-containing protein [Magnetospirillum moscoviense]OAN47854.1 hypothetical protein A6A05_03235 [Magnetospirillum moscoviense]